LTGILRCTRPSAQTLLGRSRRQSNYSLPSAREFLKKSYHLVAPILSSTRSYGQCPPLSRAKTHEHAKGNEQIRTSTAPVTVGMGFLVGYSELGAPEATAPPPARAHLSLPPLGNGHRGPLRPARSQRRPPGVATRRRDVQLPSPSLADAGLPAASRSRSIRGVQAPPGHCLRHVDEPPFS
jgi:hypothetical protein